MKHITSQAELTALAAELGVDGDWSDFSDLDLDASVEGDVFGAFVGDGEDEMILTLWRDHTSAAQVRLADLFLWAAGVNSTAADAVVPETDLAAVTAERDKLKDALTRYERITTAWTRGMYAARIDCIRGDVKAAIECLSEGLDGYDGTEWNGTETGTEWWERTKAAEGLAHAPQDAGTVPALPRVRCLRTIWTDGNPETCGLPVDHEPDGKCPGNPHARPAIRTPEESK